MNRLAIFLALGLLAAVWMLPLSGLLGPFPSTMLRHAVVVALAAPLLVIGWAVLSRRALLPPVVAAALEAVVVWAWHLPTMHDWALSKTAALVLEQASFLAVALLVWASALRQGQELSGAGALLLTSMHMTLLGALLILAPRSLYHAPHDLAGQQLGGIVMLAVVTPAYLVAGLMLVSRHLNRREPA